MRLILILIIFALAEDYYKTLGVSKSSDEQSIKKAFRRWVLKNHPARNPSKQFENEQKFAKMAAAFEVLTTPSLKKAYENNEDFQAPDYTGQDFETVYNKIFGRGGKFRHIPSSNSLYNGSKAVELDISTIGQFYNRSEVWMVKFYSPNCPHCRNMHDEWVKFADKMQGIVGVGAVNCLVEEEMCAEYQIRGFPQIFFFSDNKQKSHEEYQGQRTYESFAEYATSRITSYVKSVKKSNFDEFYYGNEEKAKVVLFTSRKSTPPLLKVLSKVLRNQVEFGEVKDSDGELCQRFGVSDFPTILALTSDSEGQKYNGKNQRAELQKWINEFLQEREEIKPEARELTEDRMKQGVCGESDSNFCFLWFLDEVDETQSRQLLDLNKRYKNDPIEFFWVKKQNSSFYQAFDANAKVVYKPKRKKFLAYEGSMEVSELEDFLGTILSGGGNFKKLDSRPVIKTELQ